MSIILITTGDRTERFSVASAGELTAKLLNDAALSGMLGNAFRNEINKDHQRIHVMGCVILPATAFFTVEPAQFKEAFTIWATSFISLAWRQIHRYSGGFRIGEIVFKHLIHESVMDTKIREELEDIRNGKRLTLAEAADLHQRIQTVRGL